MSRNSSRAWTWRHAILDAEISADCTFLLLALSCFMNEMGESCFPKIETIMEKTKRGKTWVHKYLNEAESLGWIERISVSRKTSNGDNRGWRRNEYVAIWPDEGLTSKPEEFISKGHEKGSSPDEPPLQEGSSRQINGSSPQDKKVVREANTIIPENIPKNIPSSSEADVLEKPETIQKEDDVLKSFEKKGSNYWDQQFRKIVKAHPGAEHFPTAKWKAAFFDLSEEVRQQAVDCHSTWVKLLKEKGRKFFPSLREYFEDRLFEGIKPKAEVKLKLSMKPYDRHWLAHRLWLLAQGSTGIFKPNAFQKKMIADGRKELIEQDIFKAEYPAVRQLDSSASNRDAYPIPDEEQRIMGNATRVVRGSAEWEAWKVFHKRMGWPWLELPNDFQFIIFPIALDGLNHSKALDEIRTRRKA